MATAKGEQLTRGSVRVSVGGPMAVTVTDGGPWTLPAPRLLVERFSGRFWAWLDREEFLVPKNVLDIVAAQTVTWMGLFYCPLLPLLNSVFIFLTFYIKKVQAPGLGWGAGLYLGGVHVLLLPPPLLGAPSRGLGLLGVRMRG